MLSSIAASGFCVAAKPTNIVPWSVTVPYGMLRRKMWPKVSWSVLRDVRVGGLVVELDAVGLRPADHLLLLGDRQRLPGGRVVRPLLQQQDRAARAWLAFGDEHDLGRLDRASGSRCRR